MAVPLAAHYRFTRKDYHRMAKTGILHEDSRVELVDGEVVEMSPIGRHHNAGVDRLAALFFERLRGRAIVRTQGSIVLAEYNEPQPDVVLLRPRDDFYAGVDATPEAVLLIVEVADTSEMYDRRTKAPLYARFGIPELWIADLNRGVINVYRDPGPAGYGTTQIARRGESISPLAFSDLQIAVDDVLG
jgi:Uma2 family endonuclease